LDKYDANFLKRETNIEDEKRKCNFERRLNYCISNFVPNNQPVFENEAVVKINLSYAHMIFIFFIPVVCAFGIFTSILVLKTIPHIKKDKELKDRRHYDFMRILAIVNSLLFLVKIMGLMNECTSEFWCSKINRLVGIQYLKLIFGQLIGNSLIFLTNFIYLAFQLCRLSLIGNEHSKLVVKVSNKMSIKRYVLYSASLSLVLSIVKYFRFQINDADILEYRAMSKIFFDTNDEYPAKFSSIDNLNDNYKLDWNPRSETYALTIINFIIDALNYPTFTGICLTLDIIISNELTKTLSQKIVTSKQVQEEKDEAIFKSKLTIYLNFLSNFLLKLPMTINSIFEIYIVLFYHRYLYNNSYEHVNYFLYVFVELRGAEFFETLCNFLYYLSLSLNFVFFYNFDRMFRFYFRKWFFKETNPPVTSSPNAPQKPQTQPAKSPQNIAPQIPQTQSDTSSANKPQTQSHDTFSANAP
jgi:hypothetical protein